jgi:hypothetical protein
VTVELDIPAVVEKQFQPPPRSDLEVVAAPGADHEIFFDILSVEDFTTAVTPEEDALSFNRALLRRFEARWFLFSSKQWHGSTF